LMFSKACCNVDPANRPDYLHLIQKDQK